MNGRRLRAGMSAIVALLALAGCDDGPRGPGKLEAIVAGEALGGVLRCKALAFMGQPKPLSTAIFILDHIEVVQPDG